MADQDPGQAGRARGRARGRGTLASEMLALRLGERRPGELCPAGRGGGRGVSEASSSVSSFSSSSAPGTSSLSSPHTAGTHSSHSSDLVPVELGRGATRGHRDRVKMLSSIPENLSTKKGSGGSSIDVIANYFSLVQRPDWKLYQYKVEYTPDIEDPKVRKALLYQHKEKVPKFLTDGFRLDTTVRLNADNTDLLLTSTKSQDSSQVVIKLKYVGEILPSDYAYLQFYNIVLRAAMEKLELELIRRDYYDPKAAVVMKNYKLEIWPGYVTSIRQHEKNVLLCCEISNKILRTDTVLDQMEELHRRGGSTTSFRSTVEKALLGAIVMTRYNNKTYRVDEIAWDKTPSDEFEGRNGEKRSYMKYYAERYNRTIRDAKQPLLISIAKVRDERASQTGPIYLVPELCNMTGLSEEQRSNFQMMKALGAYTRQEPKKRMETLKKFSQRISGHPGIRKDLEDWGLKFSTELETFKARVLPPEKILGGKNSSTSYTLDNADWSKCFRKWESVSAKSLASWAVVYCMKDELATKEFLASLYKVAPSLGMTIKPPKMIGISDYKPSTYLTSLDKVLDLKPELVMVVVPNNKGEHYAVIKKKLCLDVPTPSQVVTATVLNKTKGLMSVATKVAIQINCKLGGEPWAVKMPLKGTMVIGYDTYHDTVSKGRSVGAVVASLNDSMTKYVSIANIHSSNDQELHDNLCPAIVTALRKYNDLNGCLPVRIIIYRDGVGDGQIPYVMEHEVKSIRDTLLRAGLQEKDLKFTFIVVSKKINTKIIKKEGTTQSNPPSGTIVDDVVTLPERYDFFLVSQSVTQGTVNPTSYNVIHDSSGLEPDKVQRLTYKLAHLYYNWPGTVRVPAPCQYAHKLAFLVGETLHNTPKGGLENFLYYL